MHAIAACEKGNEKFSNILRFMFDLPDSISCTVQSWVAVPQGNNFQKYLFYKKLMKREAWNREDSNENERNSSEDEKDSSEEERESSENESEDRDSTIDLTVEVSSLLASSGENKIEMLTNKSLRNFYGAIVLL